MDKGGSYAKTVFSAVAIGISQIMIGATLAGVLMYSLFTKFRDLHIPLCTFGYHFFCIEAILGLYGINGWSSQIKPEHRKWAHGALQLIAMACNVSGMVIALMDNEALTKPHGITGVTTPTFALMTMVIGPLIYFDIPYSHIAHMAFAIPTLILSSITFGLGIATDAFRTWAGSKICKTLITFIVFYTLCIVTLVIIKLVMTILYDDDEDDDDDDDDD